MDFVGFWNPQPFKRVFHGPEGLTDNMVSGKTGIRQSGLVCFGIIFSAVHDRGHLGPVQFLPIVGVAFLPRRRKNS